MIENERVGEVIEGEATRPGASHGEGDTPPTDSFPMIAKTMAELEDVLAEELIELGANDVEIGTRMVSFTGDKALMYKTNVHCRTALRILKPIYSFKANSADEVYQAIKELNWEDYLSLDTTFSIDAVVFSRIFTHSKFVAYRVKDAIADWFFERYEKRPSVSVSNPDLVINIHVSHNKCTLSLDSSGESLHKRGYRLAQTEAPLNEVLAAGMILKSGWRGESAFVDPMCGSGTLLIEAAMIALGIPPGIHRQHFGFEKWSDFDQELFSTIYNDESGARELQHPIIGSDISARAIDIAEKNIKNAGLKKQIELSVKPLQQYTEAPAPEGVLMTNPPYGERMKVEELEGLYSMIGERLKHVFTGYRAYVLSYRKESFDAIGLRHSRRFFLYNGALECEMREYEIFSGKRDDRPKRDKSREKRAYDSDHYQRNSREGYRRSQRAEQGDEDTFRDESRDTRRGEKYDRPFSSRERSPFRENRPDRSDRPRRSDKSGFRPEQRSGDSESRPYKRPFDSASTPGDRGGTRPGGKFSSKPGSRPGGRPENKPSGRTWSKPGYKSDDRPHDKPGSKPFKPGGSFSSKGPKRGNFKQGPGRRKDG